LPRVVGHTQWGNFYELADFSDFIDRQRRDGGLHRLFAVKIAAQSAPLRLNSCAMVGYLKVYLNKTIKIHLDQNNQNSP
jgi:hypothetical protein